MLFRFAALTFAACLLVGLALSKLVARRVRLRELADARRTAEVIAEVGVRPRLSPRHLEHGLPPRPAGALRRTVAASSGDARILRLLAPDQFIPAAEQSSLMKPLTLAVIDKALRQLRTWREQGRPLTVAVNISARNLLDPELPDDVAGLLAAHGLEPGRLELEITENTVMVDPGRALDVLSRLSRMGVGLAVDDYGIGLSSLAYLRRLPVDTLKIDKSFITTMATDHGNASIVRSTVELAHSLGLRAVAEGVEDAAVWRALTELGCDAAQGYFLCAPRPAAELDFDELSPPAAGRQRPQPTS